MGWHVNSSTDVYQTLGEVWNGSTWSATPSPNGGPGSVLRAITCQSASSCQAAGSYQGTSGQLTLAESWNGRTWTVRAPPNRTPRNDNLQAVSCVTSSDCVATGFWQVTGP